MSDATSCGGNYFSSGSCSCGGFTGVVCSCGENFYKVAHFNTHKRMCKKGNHTIVEVWENGTKEVMNETTNTLP